MVPFLFGTFFTFGQNETDVYRYSNTFAQGSPRFDAMGGSFGALGAESGCIDINPSGFGKYSVSSFNFSLNSTIGKTSTTFRGNPNSNYTVLNDKRPEFNQARERLSNFSGVIVSDVSGNTNGFLYTQVFLGMKRVANFNNSFSYEGEQYESLLDVFCNDANGFVGSELINEAPATASLAYQTYAINPDASGTTYYPDITYGNLYHQRTVFERGGINEWYAGFSTNYIDKLLFGISYSYNSVNFEQKIIHKETLTDTTSASLRSFMYQFNTASRGGGSTVRIGATLTPTEFFRWGLAVHSPTFYEITDTYDADMTTRHESGNIYVPNGYTFTSKYKYRLWTPMKFVNSVAFIFGDMGCINVDLEYMNYGWGRLFSTRDEAYSEFNYKPTNQYIKDKMDGVVNLRVGGEFAISNAFFIRAGYAMYPKGNQLISDYGSKNTQIYSGGIGFRVERFYWDFSVRYLTATSVYYAFQESRADLKISNTTINVGFQYKFDY